MKESTITLLEACGRDRVFHNSGAAPSVAIRWSWPAPWLNRRDDEWLRAEGSDHDEAAAKVARAFAAKLRKAGEGLIDWADRIEAKLAATEPPP